MTPQSPVIGLLYPGYGAEDDFPELERRLAPAGPASNADRAIRLPLVHTSVGVDAHAVDALLDLGGAQRLAEGAQRLLAGHPVPDAVMWACTSGSFVFGWDGARRQVDQLAELSGLPASSTSLAFVNATRSLGLTTVAVAASYPEDVATRFIDFLGAGGITVAAMASQDIFTAAEVGRLGREEVIALVNNVALDGAEAILVPDTAMHSLAWLEDLEQAAGRPVLTANQVTIWEGLRLVGRMRPVPGLGALFAGRAQAADGSTDGGPTDKKGLA